MKKIAVALLSMLALMSCKNGNTCQNKTESDMISYHKIQIEDCNVSANTPSVRRKAL